MNASAKRAKWEIGYASHGSNQMVLMLQQGWEPFAVSPLPDPFSTAGVYVWFRRQVIK